MTGKNYLVFSIALTVLTLMLPASSGLAQSVADVLGPAGVVPLTASQPPARIIVGLPPGPHKVEVILANANHQPLDRATVSFTVPQAVSQ